ncbi:hypothetical protein [Helicobacter sp. 23-1045]
MKKLILMFLMCGFLATQGFSYQFNVNTKYGKLQQKCIKENDTKSCKAVLDDCLIKKIGNACEAQYSIAIIGWLGSKNQDEMLFGADLMSAAYKIGCKELKHKNTCNIDKHFLNEIVHKASPESSDTIKKLIHGE